MFYSAKYGLHPTGLPVSVFRMRPAHFPGNRLTQLAGLLCRRSDWFRLLLESPDRSTVMAELTIGPPNNNLGPTIKKSILLNAFIPILYAYGVLRQERASKDKALRWLYETPPERNSILAQWERLGIQAANAAESQALLELKKNYCTPKRCLECGIGNRLLTAPTLTSPKPSSSGIPPSPPFPDGCSA